MIPASNPDYVDLFEAGREGSPATSFPRILTNKLANIHNIYDLFHKRKYVFKYVYYKLLQLMIIRNISSFCSWGLNIVRLERTLPPRPLSERRGGIVFSHLNLPIPCFPIPRGSSSSDEHRINRCFKTSMNSNIIGVRALQSPLRHTATPQQLAEKRVHLAIQYETAIIAVPIMAYYCTQSPTLINASSNA